MKGFEIILKIFLPSVLCTLFIYLFEVNLFYFPLIFGLVIGLINLKAHKLNILFGVVLSIVISCFVFLVSYFSLLIFGKILGFLLELGNIISIILAAFFLSPVLAFTGYRYLFNFQKTKFSTIVMWVSILFLILYSYFMLIESEFNSSDLSSFKLFNPFVMWQIIMAIAIQLILYQKEIKNLFKPKK